MYWLGVLSFGACKEGYNQLSFTLVGLMKLVCIKWAAHEKSPKEKEKINKNTSDSLNYRIYALEREFFFKCFLEFLT